MTEHAPGARPSSHEFFEELAVGHALSALEPGDEQTFLAHLSGCAACERAVAEHRETMSHLAYAVPDVDPPAALLEGIRAGVLASGRPSSLESSGGSVVVPLDRAGLRRPAGPGLRRRASVLAAAAAVALLVALGVSTAELRDSRAATARLTAAVQTLAQPGSRTVPLATPGNAVRAVAVVQGEEVSLVVDGLPANDRARSIYVLWEKSGSTARPVGAFDVHDSDVAVVRGLHLASPATPGKVLAVTKEAARTAPATPGSAVLVAGQVT